MLKPLPEVAPQPLFPRFEWTPMRFAMAGASLAVLVLAILIAWPVAHSTGGFPPAQMGVKGGDLAISVVRNRDGVVSHGPDGFIDGDRFSIQLTCPPGEQDVEVSVFQGGEVFFPYDPATVSCGNRIPIPGGFALDGSEAVTVCISVGDLPSRTLLGSDGPDGLTESTVCTELVPLK